MLLLGLWLTQIYGRLLFLKKILLVYDSYTGVFVVTYIYNYTMGYLIILYSYVQFACVHSFLS
jgi:hypothetical protein